MLDAALTYPTGTLGTRFMLEAGAVSSSDSNNGRFSVKEMALKFRQPTASTPIYNDP